jgi:serine/threonine protein phosphatase 1
VIPEEHIRFIRGFRQYLETDAFIFVHAGYGPDLPMARQSGRSLRWESAHPDRITPHQTRKTVIVGHTRQKSGQTLDLGFFKVLDTDASGGWFLTAMEVQTGAIIQANQQGQSRRPGSAQG